MNLFNRIKNQIKKALRNLWLLIWSLVELPVAYLLEKIPPTRIAFWLKDTFPSFWNWLIGIAWVQRAISKGVFRRFGEATAPRPHQMTMADEYTSWKSIVDRRFTGRHLPFDRQFSERVRPQEEELVELWLRPDDGSPGGAMTQDMRSTLLFASFAQWFTDSFLRTSHALVFDDDGNVVEEGGVPKRQPGREKFNDSTHEIDLCQIYGLNKCMTDKLRSPTRKGCLRSQVIDGEEYPEFLLVREPRDGDKNLLIHKHFEKLHNEHLLRHIFRRAKTPERYKTLFATGLEHSNATIGNALFNTVFLRQHNQIAGEIAKNEPGWNDDQVFETTRNTMIVLLLTIVISDYIRHISPLKLPLAFQKGVAEAETWYRTNRIHIEFNILYRWHGLVPSQFSFMPHPEDDADFRHNNEWLIQNGVSKAISHFSQEPAGKMILGNTPRYLAPVKRDTIRIMRAAKLQPYNAYRERFGLKPAKTFSDITTDPSMAAELERLYGGNIDDVEWYIGMAAESHDRGMIMGDLMFNMVAHDAFTHALTNPLLSNEIFREETFSQVGWDYIQKTSELKDIVNRVVKDTSTVCEFALNGEHTDRV